MIRGVMFSRYGAVHRAVVQSDGAMGAGCRQRPKETSVSVRPIQAWVYKLTPCEDIRCWGTGAWRKWVEGTS